MTPASWTGRYASGTQATRVLASLHRPMTRGKDDMTPDESTEVKLVRMEGRLASIEQSLQRMEGSVERLAFVSVDLYRSEQTAQNERIEAAVKLAMWSLGLVCTTVIGLVVTGLVRLATA